MIFIYLFLNEVISYDSCLYVLLKVDEIMFSSAGAVQNERNASSDVCLPQWRECDSYAK